MKHFRSGTWQLLVKCCDDELNSSPLMKCSQIPDGPDGEQAFSTACKCQQNLIDCHEMLFLVYLGWHPDDPKYQCIGKSKYCEWDPNVKVFSGVMGACMNKCTSCCKNTQPGGGGCGKKYGWFKGFYKCENYITCPGECTVWE